jgi:hypothetical protein
MNDIEKKPKPPKQPVQWSKAAGYACFIFGILNLADLFSPIRTPAAVFIGSISIACAVFLLIPGKKAWFRKIREQWKKTAPKKQLRDPLLPVKILRLAKAHKGILTLSQVAMELNITLDDAEAGLDECVRSGLAMADFDMEKEVKYYRFQEHIRSQEIE